MNFQFYVHALLRELLSHYSARGGELSATAMSQLFKKFAFFLALCLLKVARAQPCAEASQCCLTGIVLVEVESNIVTIESEVAGNCSLGKFQFHCQLSTDKLSCVNPLQVSANKNTADNTISIGLDFNGTTSTAECVEGLCLNSSSAWAGQYYVQQLGESEIGMNGVLDLDTLMFCRLETI